MEPSVYNAILNSTKAQLGGSTTVASSIGSNGTYTPYNTVYTIGQATQVNAIPKTTATTGTSSSQQTVPQNVALGGTGEGGKVNITYVLPDGSVVSTGSGTIATTPSGGTGGFVLDKNTIIIVGIGFLLIAGLILALG